MLPRSREAVVGVRALQTDLGVRGSVGLGFVETSTLRDRTVDRLEARAANGARVRPDRGPRFDHYTTFDQICNKNNYNHGHPPVHGSGNMFKSKYSRLKQSHSSASFERKDLRKDWATGVAPRAKQRGAIVPQHRRTHDALPGWSSTVLAELDNPIS